MQDFWNNRYSGVNFFYGEDPNEYFAQQLKYFSPGKILLPAEGEGRNGVFAAMQGWEVDAFDLSAEAGKKAGILAARKKVQLNYLVGAFEQLTYEPGHYDAIGLIFAHIPVADKSTFHQKIRSWLKLGGVIILEAYSKNHLKYNLVNPRAGGPKDINLLYSTEEIIRDFGDFEMLHLEEKELYLSEGEFHQGDSAVIRFTGRKKPNIH